MARSLAERLCAHEQQKARLAAQEAKLKADERKARTRHLIQAGGLALKAGLLELEPNALYGALLSLCDAARDPEQIRQWASLGGRAFARDARLAEEGKEAIVLAFSMTLGRDATTALRGTGFRFNKLLQHWEGLARFDEAQALAEVHGGTAPARALLDVRRHAVPAAAGPYAVFSRGRRRCFKEKGRFAGDRDDQPGRGRA